MRIALRIVIGVLAMLILFACLHYLFKVNSPIAAAIAIAIVAFCSPFVTRALRSRHS